MTNIGVINYGSSASNGSQPQGDLIFSFGGFSVLRTYSPMQGGQNYFDISIDIKDDPNTSNAKVVSELFEGVDFLQEQYTLKDVTMECLMAPANGKSYSDMVIELKDIFATIKGEILYSYRGEIVKLLAVKNSLKFKLRKKHNSFIVNFTAVPFFESQVVQNISGTLTGTSHLIPISNQGHRIYPQVRLKPTSGVTGGISIGESAGRVRYIRDWSNGSNADQFNVWQEIKAIDKDMVTNRAAGIVATSSHTLDSYTNITNGVTTDTSNNGQGVLQWVQIDLGAVYDLYNIEIHRYSGRIFKETKTEVSLDGINWITLFDSEKSGTYKEVPIGKSLLIEEILQEVRGKRTIITDLGSNDYLDIDFAGGKVRKNGVLVGTKGTLPPLKKNTELFINMLNKYTFPAYDEAMDARLGLTSGSRVDLTYSTDYTPIYQVFPTNTITNLKAINVEGDNEFAYSTRMNIAVYADISLGTQLWTGYKDIYA